MTLAELRLVLTCRGDANRCGMALLLKTISHLGYVPDPTPKIPEEVRALAPDVRAGIDALLVVPESAAVSGFEGLKADPGKAGVDNLQAEIEKLRRICAIGIGTEPFANVPWKVLQMLKRRASKETASEMRDHSNVIRFALMASYLYVRTMEPEPQSLGVIKEKIGSRYGMLDLLDVFVEADRLVDFTRFFTHSGTREVRSREALRPLLILDLFGEATNMGIKQVANANDRYRYDELLLCSKDLLLTRSAAERERSGCK